MAVRAVAGLAFHSELLPNLHHVLYALARTKRGETATLPDQPSVELTDAESAAWSAAIDYYAAEWAEKDLLFSDELMRIGQALAEDDLNDPGIDEYLREVLIAAEPIYRRHFWPAHESANHAWIEDAAHHVAELADAVIPKLEQVYGTTWHQPVRVDVVAAGGWAPAYTVSRPDRITALSSIPNAQTWSAAELIFHEASHLLVRDLMLELKDALGESHASHRQLWHAILFYLTGTAVEDELRTRGHSYTQYLYDSGLSDRAWPAYRHPVEASWRPYLDGRCTRADAIATTIAALPST